MMMTAIMQFLKSRRGRDWAYICFVWLYFPAAVFANVFGWKLSGWLRDHVPFLVRLFMGSGVLARYGAWILLIFHWRDPRLLVLSISFVVSWLLVKRVIPILPKGTYHYVYGVYMGVALLYALRWFLVDRKRSTDGLSYPSRARM